MASFASTRIFVAIASLGLASLAQAQSQPVTPVPPSTNGTPTVVADQGAKPATAKPVSTKPCPVPTGSRIRPSRDANGRCPPESEEDVELDTQIGGQIGTAAGILKTQGN